MLDLSMFAETGRNEQEIVAVGSGGKAEAHVPGEGVLWVGDRSTRELRTVPVSVAPEVSYLGAHHGASWIEVDRFCAAVVDGGSPEVDATAGLWSVVVGAAAHRSIDEGRAVEISEYGLDRYA